VLRSSSPLSLSHLLHGGSLSLRITVARHVASDPIRFVFFVSIVRPSGCSNWLGAKSR
jgi:hypothetical protein